MIFKWYLTYAASAASDVGVKVIFVFIKPFVNYLKHASNENWTHDPWFTRPVLCLWAIEAYEGQIYQRLF